MEDKIKNIIRNGTISEKKGNYEMALNYYNEALELAKEANYRKQIYKCYLKIGQIKEIFGKYSGALENYLDALKISEMLDNSIYKANLFLIIGHVYYKWHKYEKAITYYEKSVSINEEYKKNEGIATGLGSIGTVYFQWGKNQKAFEYFQKALKYRKKAGNKKNIGIDYNNIGMTYFNGKNYQEALKFFNKAYVIWKEVNFKEGLAYLSNNIGNCYINMKEYKKAVDKIKEYLNYAKKNNLIQDKGLAYNNLGVIYAHLKEIDKSNNYFNNALKIYAEINDLQKIKDILINMGVNYWKTNNFDDAYKYLTRAIEISEYLVGKVWSEEIRTTYRTLNLDVNMILTKMLIDRYTTDHNDEHLLEALKFLEMSKSREIIDKFEKGNVEIKKIPEQEDLILKERELIQQIMRLQGILDSEIQGGQYETPTFKELIEKGKELRKIRKNLLEKCKDPGLIRSIIDYNPIPEFKKIFDIEDVVIWEFLFISFLDDYKEKFHILVFDRNKIDLYESNKFNSAHVSKLLKNFYLSLSEGEDFSISIKYIEKLKNELSDLIPNKLLDSLNGKKKLILIPHDILHLYPWEIVEKISLKVPIVRSYSLSILKSCINREKQDQGFLLISNPNFNLEQLDLPGADYEIKSIISLIEGTNSKYDLLKHEEANEPNFIDKLKNPYGIIHFAGHGTYNLIGEDSWMSGLLFYDREGYELLTITDIINTRFSTTPLFILSACETARSEFNVGDELVGIIRGITLAGSTSIIATNWLLSDEVAPYFMKKFYENFLNGHDVCDSLFNARKYVYDLNNGTFKSPIYWGVYSLYGNPFKKF